MVYAVLLECIVLFGSVMLLLDLRRIKTALEKNGAKVKKVRSVGIYIGAYVVLSLVTLIGIWQGWFGGVIGIIVLGAEAILSFNLALVKLFSSKQYEEFLTYRLTKKGEN